MLTALSCLNNGSSLINAKSRKKIFEIRRVPTGKLVVHPGGYHYRDDNYNALDSVFLIHEMLERIGIVRERSLIDWASVGVGTTFHQIITTLTEKNRFLGPLSQVEDKDQNILRRQSGRAAEVARGGGKIRSGLINASRKMIKSRDFQEKLLRVSCRRSAIRC